MKTINIKSILLLLFGVLSTLIFSSLIERHSKTQISVENDSSALCISAGNAPTKVNLLTAQDQAAFYKAWLKFIPQRANLEGNRIVYDDFEITDQSELEFIQCYIDMYRNTNGLNENDWLPFTGLRSHAYAISIEDIVYALNALNDKQDSLGTTANGIRVYLAIDSLFTFDQEKIQSHVYVVPTYDSSGTTKDFIPGGQGNQYVYDLTHPCPAACDNRSIINNSILPSCQSNH